MGIGQLPRGKGLSVPRLWQILEQVEEDEPETNKLEVDVVIKLFSSSMTSRKIG
jgi:hypothetical protein